MPPTSTAAVPETPRCSCRVCGQVMEAKYQAGLLPGRAGYFYLTCWNGACWMNGYTLADVTYPKVDLSVYQPVSL